MLLSKVSFGLLVTAPITAKTVPSPGDEPFLVFPLQVWNNSAAARTGNADDRSARYNHVERLIFEDDHIGEERHGRDQRVSSTTREIYATTTSPINVQVSDGTTTTGITFNGVAGGASTPSAPASITVTDPLKYLRGEHLG